MNENRNEYFAGVVLVIIGILSTALFIDGFYFQSAIFNMFSSGFSRWAENMFGIFSIMMFSIPAIIGIILVMGEKSANRLFMLLGYILLALLIPPFFHKFSGNNYNAGVYGMKVSELFSGSGSTAIEAAIYFLWLGLSVGFLLFPIRSKIVESVAKLLKIETSPAYNEVSNNSYSNFSHKNHKDNHEKHDYSFTEKEKTNKTKKHFNISKLFSVKNSEPAEHSLKFENHNYTGISENKKLFTEQNDLPAQKSSSFKVTTRLSLQPTEENEVKNETLKPHKKSIFQIDESDANIEQEAKKETPAKKSIFEVLQPTQSNKSSNTIPWVSKVIYESDDKRMEVPIFSKAPIKKFKMKKNEENIEEYTQVDTLSSKVYNKVAVGSENVKVGNIDSRSYFQKVKDYWPESWKTNVDDNENKEEQQIVDENNITPNYPEEIPDYLEETTEEQMLNEEPEVQEIEAMRVVSEPDVIQDEAEESVSFEEEVISFTEKSPFDFDDDDDDDFFQREIILDSNEEKCEADENDLDSQLKDDEDWDFRKAREMDEAFNSGEWKRNITNQSFNSQINSLPEEQVQDYEDVEECDEFLPEAEEYSNPWKNNNESINSSDIKKFFNQNMESYSHFKEEKPKVQPQVTQMQQPVTQSFETSRPSGLYQQAMHMRNNMNNLPSGNLLRENTQRINPEEYQRVQAESAAILESTLAEFGIKAKVCDIIHGPVVTLFKIIPAPGIKLSKIEGLSDNLALRLAAQSIRIIAPIPGEKVVGIEVPNSKRELISFKEVINSESFANNSYQVPVGLGKDIYGKVVSIDVHKMPHILIAGATGAGKSVCVNGFLCSILFSRAPEDVKMILIDPKVVELQPYDGIPHLLTPVITDPKDAVNALKYLVYEMEERYKILGKIGVRSIVEYRKMVKEGKLSMSLMPFIICVVDEFADLMTTVGKEAEMLFARLTAKARAVGIHLVLATQRPSADVITGVIKSNVPARIAFQVISYQDSRIILDQKGAEKLLGQGDMLYLSPTQPHPVRLQGAFLDKEEVDLVVEHWKSLAEPEYIDIGEILGIEDEESFTGGSGGDSVSNDPLYEEAVEVVLQTKKASASYLQRRLSIGYNRAARLIEEMEAQGIVGPMQGSKPREVFGSAGSSNADDNYF